MYILLNVQYINLDFARYEHSLDWLFISAVCWWEGGGCSLDESLNVNEAETICTELFIR